MSVLGGDRVRLFPRNDQATFEIACKDLEPISRSNSWSLLTTETEYSKFRAGKALEIQRLELQAKSFESSMPKQFSLLNIKKGMSILDAGCGTGSFARSVAK